MIEWLELRFCSCLLFTLLALVFYNSAYLTFPSSLFLFFFLLHARHGWLALSIRRGFFGFGALFFFSLLSLFFMNFLF